MKILAIETSCDETALAYLSCETQDTTLSIEVLGNIVHSQIDIHQEFGGVFPALAKREHQKNMIPLLLTLFEKRETSQKPLSEKKPPSDELREGLQKILEKEPLLYEHFIHYIIDLPRPDIDVICVTTGPGLEPALWVGINTAQALGFLWNIPVVPINHMEGHLVSVLIPKAMSSFLIPSQNEPERYTLPAHLFSFPALGLLISGGHTELVLMESFGTYRVVGKTRDDALGEAFDKTARMLGIPYPGGPEISRAAETYRSARPETSPLLPFVISRPGETSEQGKIFPRPMIHSQDYDFSFSGLKTAVRYFIDTLREHHQGTLPHDLIPALCYEFESAAADVIIYKTKKACQEFGAKTVIVGGGVAANTFIQKGLIETLSPLIPQEQILFPQSGMTGDNALMIGLAGYLKIQHAPDRSYGPLAAEGTMVL